MDYFTSGCFANIPKIAIAEYHLQTGALSRELGTPQSQIFGLRNLLVLTEIECENLEIRRNGKNPWGYW